MSFRPEPEIARAADGHAGPDTGVLLVNLGTPDAPTPAATRRYLAEFLSDPRVVELPVWLWQPLLRTVVLPFRPAQSAAKYRTIWMREGSPLMVWTQKQAKLLRGALGERGLPVHVQAAMRYGRPSIAQGLDELKRRGCTRVLALPLYPQYSGSTTASVADAVGQWTRGARVLPELRWINGFATNAGYIRALTRTVHEFWQTHGQPDKVVMSFHGLPERMVQRGDPYLAQCRATARRLAERLALKDGQWTLAFQSRFGRAKWIGPSTQDVLTQLGKAGTRRLDLICPGFVSDCLETLEEIAVEGKETFHHAGGGEFRYIPCLNDHPVWIGALADMAQAHLRGWAAESASAAPPRPAAL